VTRARRLTPPAALLVLVLVGASLLGATAAGAKKNHKRIGAVNITMPVNAGIPDSAGGSGLDGQLISQIVVGKRFKGKSIGDVNVTIQTAGNDPDSAFDLVPYLTAPNGTTVGLFNALVGRSIGPLTLDDEAGAGICTANPPPCKFDPFYSLTAPYAGTAEPASPLSLLDLGPVRGVWTLYVHDLSNGNTSTLVSWTLNVTPARPVK
jgi:hypothetical protein